jgi:phage tail P2-like protein
MSDTLLPPNATKFERALEGSTSRVSDVPILVRESWNPDTCPVELLPWLAWAFSVDSWDGSWDEATKRSVIRTAFDVQRRKGTVASVKTIRDSFGFSDGVLQEGLAAGGTWAQYKFTFTRLLTIAQCAAAQRAIRATAPSRDQLLSFDHTSTPLYYNGAATYDGTYAHGAVING